MTADQKPEISIVTRAYNVESYIQECADSVLGQSFSNFEWIVLDNGSTDRTGELLNDYAQRDARIRLFVNKKNYNKIDSCKEYYSYVDLLRETRGRYITDLDSDDMLHQDFLKILYQAALEQNADIAAAGSIQFRNNNIKDIAQEILPKAFCDKDITQMGKDINDFYDAFRPVWGKLIARNLYLDNLDYFFKRPCQLTFGGDTYTMLRLLQLAESCVCVERPLYYYRVRRNSITWNNYYQKRYQSYDVIFYEGFRLLQKWDQMSPENLEQLCLYHLGGIYSDISVIYHIQGISMAKKAGMIEELFLDQVYRDYIVNFTGEFQRQWDEKLFAILNEIWQRCEEKEERFLFYPYHYSRRYLARKMLAENSADLYDIMCYVAASVSARNEIRYEDELMKTCVSYLTGKPCASWKEAEIFIQQCTIAEGREEEKKKKLNQYISENCYSKVQELLQTFNKEMDWDCDVLFTKACYHCAAGETETAIKILAVAQELYPQERVIEENLKNLCSMEKRS